MRLFLIRIDLQLLRENLSREDGHCLNDQEILRWLDDAGFRPSVGGWTVQETDLGQLNPSEVISVEVVDAPTMALE
jgi:hypothetical protein